MTNCWPVALIVLFDPPASRSKPSTGVAWQIVGWLYSLFLFGHQASRCKLCYMTTCWFVAFIVLFEHQASRCEPQ